MLSFVIRSLCLLSTVELLKRDGLVVFLAFLRLYLNRHVIDIRIVASVFSFVMLNVYLNICLYTNVMLLRNSANLCFLNCVKCFPSYQKQASMHDFAPTDEGHVLVTHMAWGY